MSQAPVLVENLRCENLANPLALETPTPRLSWAISGTDRGIFQQSYRVLVASSSDKLNRNEGDLWDSGIVNSDQSLWVPYAGQTLNSRRACFWKVMVVTTKGVSSGWSTMGQWTMGLLQASDRQAQWIGLERTFEWDAPTDVRTRLSARYLRKEIALTKPIRQATAYVCGLGLYELHLNGQRIGTQVLAPGPTQFNKRVFYNTYDVTAQLRQGTNAVGITLGNGHFFRMRLNAPGLPETTHYGLPRCWFQLEVTYTDGSTKTVVSDTSWKITADGPIRANNEYDGEEYDATRELANWHLPGYNDSAWLAAEQVTAPASRLESQPNPPIRVMQLLRPRSIQLVREGVYVMDMGQNMTGWIRLRVTGNRGTRLTMRFAETISGDGAIESQNLRSAQQTDVYTLRGGGIEVWEPRFTAHGFRYVELSGFPTAPTVEQFEGCVVHDDMTHSGQFTSSNALLNQIVTSADWGIRGNYQGIPTDCPQRDERLGWLGDRTTGAYGESFLYNNQAFYAKWLGDIEDAQSDQGSIPDVVPTYWALYTDNITWPTAYASVANMLYDQFGDLAPIRTHYASMKRWIQYIDQFQVEYDYWKDQYGDWAVPPEAPYMIHTEDPNRRTSNQVLGSTHYYYVLKLLERFATLLGNDTDRAWFANRAGLVRDAFNRNHWDANKQQYANNSTTANVLPLALGMVPDDRRERVVTNMISRLTGEYDTHVSTGIVGLQWLMRTLTDAGRPDLAYRITTNTTYPSLGYMLQKGSTTIWELWNGDTADRSMNSGNHVMQLGDLLIWLYENVAGIKAAEPAFRRLRMAPIVPGDLNQISATHRSPYGLIASAWQKSERGFQWTVTVPGNCRAEVAIPASSPSLVWEGSRKALGAPDLTFLRQEGDRAVFAVGSGTYVFTNSPPANLVVQLVADKRVIMPGGSVQLFLTARNEGPEPATNILVGTRLSPQLTVVSAPGLSLTDGQLLGQVSRLEPGNQITYSLLLRPTVPGFYIQSAQITATDQQDPTSMPNSGTGDGEDDAAQCDFRLAGSEERFVSPNPNQRSLPAVIDNQPGTDVNTADVSLSMTVSSLTPRVGELLTYTLALTNRGGTTAMNIQVSPYLPANQSLVAGGDIILTDGKLAGMVTTLVAGATRVLQFQTRVTGSGRGITTAQITGCDTPDPDSTPNNGTANGEDDTGKVEVRTP